MDKIKYLIMIGGTLILLGVILKVAGVAGPWAAMSFGVGGTLKLIYLIVGARTGQLKIGAEIALLVIGLLLIFMAVYFRKTQQLLDLYPWFLSVGIIGKVIFVVLFIRRQKRFRKELALE